MEYVRQLIAYPLEMIGSHRYSRLKGQRHALLTRHRTSSAKSIGTVLIGRKAFRTASSSSQWSCATRARPLRCEHCGERAPGRVGVVPCSFSCSSAHSRSFVAAPRRGLVRRLALHSRPVPIGLVHASCADSDSRGRWVRSSTRNSLSARPARDSWRRRGLSSPAAAGRSWLRSPRPDREEDPRLCRPLAIGVPSRRPSPHVLAVTRPTRWRGACADRTPLRARFRAGGAGHRTPARIPESLVGALFAPAVGVAVASLRDNCTT